MNAVPHKRDIRKTSRACGLVPGVRVMVTAVAIAVVSVALFFCSTDRVLGADQEYLIKAAFLYNFAKFVEWPSPVSGDRTAPLGVCIIGQDRFGDALGTLKNKTVEGRPISVRKGVKPDEADRCHIFFISTSEKENLPQILKTIRGAPVLTVGDTEGFARSGVMINLVPIGNRIGFEINLSAVEATPLKISSKLLKLGKAVR